MSSGRLQDKTLVVSKSLLPKRSGSSIVMENLASHFSPGEMAMLGDCGIGKKISRPRSSEFPNVEYFGTAISIAGRGARFFRRLRWQLLDRLVNRIVEYAGTEKCQHLLGVYPDDLWCLAACRAAKTLGQPFDSYFHNTYADNAAIRDPSAKRYQREIFSASRTVFVMSDGMRDFMQRTYTDTKFVSLPHTFRDYPAPPSEWRCKHSGPYRILLFGNFNQSNMDATRRLAFSVDSDPKFQLHFYTDVPRRLMQQRGLTIPADQYHGPLGHFNYSDLIAEIRKYDVVALTHGLTGDYGNVEYETIFPTRTIPMLLSGLPILVHAPDNSFLTRFFRDHESGFVVTSTDHRKLSSVLKQIVSDPENARCRIQKAWDSASQFHGESVANLLREQISAGAVVK